MTPEERAEIVYRILARIPEGVEIDDNGRATAICQGCGEYHEILCDISEIPMEGYEHYCGRSPYCCP